MKPKRSFAQGMLVTARGCKCKAHISYVPLECVSLSRELKERSCGIFTDSVGCESSEN